MNQELKSEFEIEKIYFIIKYIKLLNIPPTTSIQLSYKKFGKSVHRNKYNSSGFY